MLAGKGISAKYIFNGLIDEYKIEKVLITAIHHPKKE
jgi:hypothetical protein